MPLQKRAIDTATTEEKTSLYTHTCIILTTHCQHPLSLESFTLGKTQCNTTTLDRPCAHHLLQGEHHRYQHLLQDCRVHLHLLQQQDGAVFEKRWRNSIDTVYTIGLLFSPALEQILYYTWSAAATQPLQLIMYSIP